MDVIENEEIPLSQEEIDKIENWFRLGEWFQLLESNCDYLHKAFKRQRDSVKGKSPSLARSLKACAWHVSQMGTSNHTVAKKSRNYAVQLDLWCAIASMFLRNRTAFEYLLLVGENWIEEDEADCPDQWPPAPLPTEWFSFVESGDILTNSQDALYQQCLVYGIQCPYYSRVVYAKEDGEEEKVKAAMKEWQCLVLYHLMDLSYFHGELALLKFDEE